MIRWLREFRLVPVVLVATTSLLALKVYGLIFDGGFTLGQRLGSQGTLVVTTVPIAPPAQLQSPSKPLQMAPVPQRELKPSWMQEMFNYPGGGNNSARNSASNSGDITGSIKTTKPAEKAATEAAEAANKKEAPKEPPPDKGGTVIAMDQQRNPSPGERALLERLQERRAELDARQRELDMREGMLKAAEKKLETETTAQKAEGAKDSEGKRKDEADSRFKAVVTMYETMKPKDAAKIFDRLDIKVLIEVASQIKPQRMSEILANMSPEAAERLTVELTAKNAADRSVNPANLPKIEGRPNGS